MYKWPKHKKLFRGGRKKSARHLWTTLALLTALSAYQFYEHGKITWPQTVVAEIEDYSEQLIREWNRPDHEAPIPPTGQSLTGKVFKVTDGDTFTLLTAEWYEYIIRLHGIDAPERDQPHGIEASRALTRSLDDRKVTVMIEDIDDYGRLVGQVDLEGNNINLAMVKGGHAWWYKQYAKSNHALAEAEADARAADIGLWADINPVPPWIWRRGH